MVCFEPDDDDDDDDDDDGNINNSEASGTRRCLKRLMLEREYKYINSTIVRRNL